MEDSFAYNFATVLEEEAIEEHHELNLAEKIELLHSKQKKIYLYSSWVHPKRLTVAL